jgi:hypothetical protein
MVREARILRGSLSLAQTYDLPAKLTLRQWIATLEMIERIAQYLQIDLNNLPLSLCVNKKNLHWRNSFF